MPQTIAIGWRRSAEVGCYRLKADVPKTAVNRLNAEVKCRRRLLSSGGRNAEDDYCRLHRSAEDDCCQPAEGRSAEDDCCRLKADMSKTIAANRLKAEVTKTIAVNRLKAKVPKKIGLIFLHIVRHRSVWHPLFSCLFGSRINRSLARRCVKSCKYLCWFHNIVYIVDLMKGQWGPGKMRFIGRCDPTGSPFVVHHAVGWMPKCQRRLLSAEGRRDEEDRSRLKACLRRLLSAEGRRAKNDC